MLFFCFWILKGPNSYFVSTVGGSKFSLGKPILKIKNLDRLEEVFPNYLFNKGKYRL
jgi:hypothetical protein